MIVYSFLLSTAKTKRWLRHREPRGRAHLQKPMPAYYYSLHPAVLRVNHQIYAEAVSIWQNNLFVCVSIPSGDQDDLLHEGLGILAHWEARWGNRSPVLEKFFYMQIEFENIGGRNRSFDSLLISADDLPRLCQLLLSCTYDRYNVDIIGRGSSVEIDLLRQDRTTGGGSTAFERLLEPFRRFHTMSRAEINDLTETASKSSTYRAEICEEMKKASHTKQAWQSFAEERFEESRSLFEDGCYLEAIQQSQSALNEFDAIAFRWNERMPETSQQLLAHLNQLLAAAHHRLGNHIEMLECSDVAFQVLGLGRLTPPTDLIGLDGFPAILYWRYLASVESWGASSTWELQWAVSLEHEDQRIQSSTQLLNAADNWMQKRGRRYSRAKARRLETVRNLVRRLAP